MLQYLFLQLLVGISGMVEISDVEDGGGMMVDEV
jgi:hypothetical protein